MGDRSAIEWTTATWNPVTGCDRMSPGCDHCYALTLAKRLKAMGNPRYQRDGEPPDSGPGFGVTPHEALLDLPLGWHRPRRIFVNSMSDLFHPTVPDTFIGEVFARMGLAQQHQFQVLTKRPQRMAAWASGDMDTPWGRWPRSWYEARTRRAAQSDIQRRADRQEISLAVRWPLPCVWMGTSIESDRYSFRANYLRETPAAVRFLSLEPLLGPLPSLDLTGIDWVIVGGESGPGARPMHPDWVRDIRDRCVAAGVPFFLKQWGQWGLAPGGSSSAVAHVLADDGTLYAPGDLTWPDGPRRAEAIRQRHDHGNLVCVYRTGKKTAGRLLDGRTWDEMPA